MPDDSDVPNKIDTPEVVQIDNFLKKLNSSEGSTEEKVEKAKRFLRDKADHPGKKTKSFIQRGFESS